MADILHTTTTPRTNPLIGILELERSDQSIYDPTHDFQGKEVWRSETPETMLPDFPHRPGPDISIRCDKCYAFVDLPSLKEHRQFHSALSTLKYSKDFPNTSDALLKRRNAVLRKLKSAATQENPVQPEEIERVNEAYEYLKSIVDGTFEELRQVREDVDANVDGIALNCSPDCAYAVGIAASGNERWKSQMEDARAFQDCFGEDRNKCYVGLFDGYHGRFAAEVAASELHKILLHEMMKFDPHTVSTVTSNLAMITNLSQYKFERPNTSQSERVILYDESVSIIQNIINICESKYEELIKEENGASENTKEERKETQSKQRKKEKSPFMIKMEKAFSKCYYLLDILLSYGKDEHSKIRWSGCSAVTAVIQSCKEEENENYGKVFGEFAEKDETQKENDGAQSVFDPPKDVGKIHLANVGNTHAVLVRGNRAYTITKDHTPNNKKEKERIINEGADLSESDKECRVNGVIMTTRGLGNHGDKKLKKCILVEPYTTCVPIDQYAQFLILATHGVWEVFSKQEAASLLLRLLPSNQIPPPSKVNSTLRPLLEELNRHSPAHHSEPNSRRVSFSSVETPRQRKLSVEKMRPNSYKSPALQSVQEGAADGQAEDKGSRSEVNTPKISITGSGTPDQIEEGKKSREFHHSTPTQSSITSSAHKKSRYTDHDMQTEVGSRHGDQDEDSGNEADVDTYLENMSPFPGTISRISVTGGPVTKEQVQRNQAKLMAEHLVQAALLAGAKDNVSVMVVLLPGCGL